MNEELRGSTGEKKLGLKTYLSYGVSNSGGTVVFSSLASLVTLFWTDYVGIAPAMIATVMLISKFLDALSNIVAGFLIQRTRSKWGQARPWMLWFAIPFGLSCVGCFLVPVNASEVTQFWYMFIAYNFANTVCYTVVDLAEGTMCSLLSRRPEERERLGSFRLGLCVIGHVLAGGCTLTMVHSLGNNQRAWILVMSIWGAYSVVVHLICFFNCKEQVKFRSEAYDKRPPVLQQVKALLSSQYWWWAFLYWGIWATTFTLTGTTMTYYCRYILHNDGLYTIFFILEKIIWGVFNLSMPIIRRRLGWTIRRMFVVGALMCMLPHLLLLAAPLNLSVNVFIVVMRGIGMAGLSSFFNGVIANVTDFGQYKTHQRQEALVFAAASMGEKIDSGLIMAFVTALLGMAGFVSSTTGGTVQDAGALSMISNLYIWGNVIIYGVLGIIVSRYKLDGKMDAIQRELALREAKGIL